MYEICIILVVVYVFFWVSLSVKCAWFVPFFHGFDKYYGTEDVTSAVSFLYTLSDPGNKIITVNWNEENAVP